MKRYLIFAAIGPLLGGFWLLLTTTLLSGYWSSHPSAAEVGKLFTVFATTLQYSYLFGLLPSLMIGAVEDILFHVKRIGAPLRILLVGVAAFAASVVLRDRKSSARDLIDRASVILAHDLFGKPLRTFPDQALASVADAAAAGADMEAARAGMCARVGEVRQTATIGAAMEAGAASAGDLDDISVRRGSSGRERHRLRAAGDCGQDRSQHKSGSQKVSHGLRSPWVRDQLKA
jgi:Family of unknown function (DUF5413)